MIGSPLFTRLTLTLESGKRFVVSAPQNSSTNLYIQAVKLNGHALDRPFITYREITAGGVLEFDMGPSPSAWASSWRGTPLSAP
jgi:putative alpha-1,2-mannosidase